MEIPKNVEKMLKSWSKEYKKGFFAYFILLLLKDRSMYGFEIIKQLLEITESRIQFQESGIYQILKNLKRHSMVSSKWEKSDKGPKRKYYILEQSGIELLKFFTSDYILPITKVSETLIEKHFPELLKTS
jgi:PadR family transcriptional regulator PadR